MMHRGFAAVALMGAALSAAGCATYQRAKADLVYGRGQSQQLIEAKNRLEDLRAEQLSLQEEQLIAQEELAALQAELQSVNRNRSVQQQRLAQASRQAKISEAESRRLAQDLERRTEAFNDKALQLETARQSGNEAAIRQREAELATLKAELDQLNREIVVLAR